MAETALRETEAETSLSTRTIVFINIAHALDHYVLLIWPTAVLAIALDTGLDYGSLLALATGAFVAFGLCSLPMGSLADRYGRRNLMVIFFVGYGLSCLGVAGASAPPGFAVALLVLGIMSAIYHPVGTAMLVTHARSLGRDLGWNGVWGNLGAAFASGVTAILAAQFGWRMAFIVPGLVCILAGVAFMRMVPGDGTKGAGNKGAAAAIPVARPKLLFVLFALALVGGGMTFNLITIPIPKVIDERLGMNLPLAWVGSLATAIFLFGALTQLLIGRLVDRFTLPQVFVGLSLFQPIGLAIASVSTGPALLAGLIMAMAASYGQVIVNDAMVARYVPPDFRARAYSVRYFLGFATAGMAVPLIAFGHGLGGFPLVLAIGALFGGLIFTCALLFLAFSNPPQPSAEPAE
jgi:MFS family permease